MSRAQQFLLPFVALLAVVGVGLGVYGLQRDPPSTAPLQRQVTALRADLAVVKATATHAATIGNVTTLQSSVSGLTATMHGVQGDLTQLHNCLPELDQEVGALDLNTSTQSLTLGDGSTDTFLTNAYIDNPTVISNNCTRFLTGVGR